MQLTTNSKQATSESERACPPGTYAHGAFARALAARPRQDIRNCLVLTRAASRGKGADHACDRLGNLERYSGKPDLALYNLVLDACISQETLPYPRLRVEHAGTFQSVKHFASSMLARFSR